MAQSAESDFIATITDDIVVIDVRTPKEFEQGHIPGAKNLPLFSNEERAKVGTCYKQKGKEEAIHLGLEIVGPKLASFVTTANKLAPNKNILIHCWRGGMRSSSMAWLLELSGFKIRILKGGYKAYRNFVLSVFERNYKLKNIGGRTGSGKTGLLYLLKEKGKQIVDLEELAQHKGSAFGNIGYKGQPTSEQFENKLAHALLKLNSNEEIWIEDESRSIGKCFIPLNFWQQLRNAPLYVVKIDDEVRIKKLLIDYGNADKEELAQAILKLEKRLGNEKMKEALQFLEEGNLEEVTKIMLRYYDKAYDHLLTQKETKEIHQINGEGITENQIIEKILNA